MMMNREKRREAVERQKRRARRERRALLLILLVLAALIAVGVFLLHEKSPAPSPQSTDTGSARPSQASPQTTAAPQETEAPQTTEAAETEASTAASTEASPEDESWKLVLVNATHPLPEGFTVTLKELRNGHHVDERIYPELQQMFDDARAAEIYPFINESFRTAERQQEIMDDYVASYEAQGLSHEEAVEKAHSLVAEPGTSEHQLGLAVDIVAEYDADSTATWQWLKENAWRYGFILRYPADKVEITGIDYEPWHYRYVGKEAAKEITERGLCLEEYVADAG
jgi:D-alanyl-D-alanine carboxypeptidase